MKNKLMVLSKKKVGELVISNITILSNSSNSIIALLDENLHNSFGYSFLIVECTQSPTAKLTSQAIFAIFYIFCHQTNSHRIRLSIFNILYYVSNESLSHLQAHVMPHSKKATAKELEKLSTSQTVLGEIWQICNFCFLKNYRNVDFSGKTLSFISHFVWI